MKVKDLDVFIEVTVLTPEDFVSKFNMLTDTFNLEGFSVARQEASELC